MTRAWELGGPADQTMNLLAPLPGGDMVVVGDIYGQVDFGSGIVATAELGDDLVVARIRPDGVAVWAIVGTGGAMAPQAVAVDAAGRIAVSGSFGYDLVFADGTPDEFGVYTADGSDGFVAVFDSSGQLEWARTMQSALGEEDVEGLAFDAVGNLWASGRFKGTDTTISAGKADAVVLAGDDDPNLGDAFLVRYGPTGALLGIASVIGNGEQEGLTLAARPAGGVDWLVDRDAEVVPVSDMTGLATPLPVDATQPIVRLDGTGRQLDSLALSAAVKAMRYMGGDLLVVYSDTLPATIPAWDESAPLELTESPFALLFDGAVTWVNGVAPVAALAIDPGGHIKVGFASELGSAVGTRVWSDEVLLYDTLEIEVEDSDFSGDDGRPAAVAWDSSGTLSCAVDIEASGVPWAASSAMAVALDDGGGFWMAGQFRDARFTVESFPGGPPAAVLDATPAEDDQGFLVRWQLWPGPASSPRSATP